MSEEILDSAEIKAAKVRTWKWLKIVERVCIALACIGLIFKTMHWKWGVELVMFPTLLLSFLYLIFFFKLVHHHHNSRSGNMLSVVVGLIISTTVLIILFRIMLWPGFGEMTYIGFICLLLIGILAIAKSKGAIHLVTVKKAGMRLLVFGGLSIWLFTVSIRSQIDFYYDNQASENLLDAFVDQYENPSNEAMRDRYNRLRVQHMDSLYGY